MVIPSLIECKRDGAELPPGTWAAIVHAYASEEIPDYQMSALLMAVVWRGLSAAELAELTAARGSRVVSAWGIGALHASLGDIEDAFTWLETAIKEKASGLMWLRVHPRLDPIRQDPRYWPMVERVGLTDLPSDG